MLSPLIEFIFNLIWGETTTSSSSSTSSTSSITTSSFSSSLSLSSSTILLDRVGGLIRRRRAILAMNQERRLEQLGQVAVILREQLKDPNCSKNASSLIESTIRRQVPDLPSTEMHRYKRIVGRSIVTNESIVVSEKAIDKKPEP